MLAESSLNLKDLLNPLTLFGFAGQFVFFLRFVVQWWASEKRGRTVVPELFWYLSIAGGIMVGIYAIQRRDVVFIAAQFLGVAIYLRNLVLIHRRKGRIKLRQEQASRLRTREQRP